MNLYVENTNGNLGELFGHTGCVTGPVRGGSLQLQGGAPAGFGAEPQPLEAKIFMNLYIENTNGTSHYIYGKTFSLTTV